MPPRTRLHPHLIDLTAGSFNTHKVGLPEWLKNSREAYLRKGVDKVDERIIVVHLFHGARPSERYLECIDFAGISGDDIDAKYLEWGKPDASAGGKLSKGDQEGGQGNGGKSYLRELFETGFFASIFEGKLSVVAFHDAQKHKLDFYPDEVSGKDNPGENPAWKTIRKDACIWLDHFGLPKDANITIARGISPKKKVEPDGLFKDILGYHQARETITSCKVLFYENWRLRRQLTIIRPTLHTAFPSPKEFDIPEELEFEGEKVATTRGTDFPSGKLFVYITQNPLTTQDFRSWNRLVFYATGVSSIGQRQVKELPLRYPQYNDHVYGECRLPLLKDPADTYETQGRIWLKDGPLSNALYEFAAEKIDGLLEQLAGQVESKKKIKRSKNLQKLNEFLSSWIVSQMASSSGWSMSRKKTRMRAPGKRKERAGQRSNTCLQVI